MKEDPKDFREISDDIMIVKGRFKAGSFNLYGQFILVFKNDSNFESYNAVVSTYSDLYNLEPHESWTKYREFIANVKWKGNFNTTMTSSLMNQFKKFSEQMNSISLLYDNVSDYDYNAMDVILFDLVNRIIHDKNLILETAIQEATPLEYRTAVDTAAPEDEKPDVAPAARDGYGIEDDAVILSVKPIVAPVRGRPVYELRVGDKLLVYIQPQSDRANYFIDLLNLREKDEIKPTPGEVIDIKSGSGKNNPTDILTLIAPGIYGTFTELEKQVKLKMYDPEIDGPGAKKKTGAINGKASAATDTDAVKAGFSKGTIVMLVLFMIILTLFIVLIFLSW
ncbi:MAG: hypothetical protein A2176_12070 [Spirochaetes bacterium RBG_13_51_14]|nr:MAG: hypothetical protein A2176_12070 [Spirochaetes bacterium RBG_13_51_14]